RFMEIINGIVIFFLALLLMLPIPFSNFIFATILIIISLGLIEKDGLFLIIGYLGVMIYANFVYLFVLTAMKHWLS
ncbi:TPA: exopolysaccharide biosynthesis protein, partial [Legionella pneumophila]